MDFTILEKISPAITSLGFLGFFLYLVYEKLRGTSSKIYQDSSKDYETRIKQLEDTLKENEKKSNDRYTANSNEIATLRGELTAEKAHSAEYLEIIKDKNPDMLKLLEALTASNVRAEAAMNKVLDWMKQSQTTLDYQSTLLEKTDKRNDEIDKAHGRAAQ